MPGGKEEEQETENLLENIMKKNFLNLMKEIDIQVQGSTQESQTNWTQRGPHQHTS